MKKFRKGIRRAAAVALAFLMAGSTLPAHTLGAAGDGNAGASVNAEEALLNQTAGSVDIADVSTGDSYGQITVNSENLAEWDGKTLTGSTKDKTLIINGVTLNLTIKDLTIDRSAVNSERLPAIGVTGGGALSLTLEGTNYLYGSTGGAGIWVDSGATLKITAESTGAVTAVGGNRYGGAAGIGAYASGMNYELAVKAETRYAGTILIEGGTVTARGGTYTVMGKTQPESGGAGIGGTYGKSGAVIKITGGRVTAHGGFLGAGIGGGSDGSVSGITITGGTVTAVCGDTIGVRYPAAIGSGMYDTFIPEDELSFGTISITGGVVAAEGDIGYGDSVLGIYPAEGGSVTIAEGAYPVITGSIKAGDGAAATAVRYTFGFTVYDGRFTEDTTADVWLGGVTVTGSAAAKVSTPGRAEVTVSFYTPEMSGSKSFAFNIDGREYTADVVLEEGKTEYSQPVGTPLYPVKLEFYDETITGDLDVSEVVISRGGTELSAAKGEYWAPDKISLVTDTYGVMLCYLPAGDNTSFSVTAASLNGGAPIVRSGETVTASDTNTVVMIDEEGVTLYAALKSIAVLSAEISVRLNTIGTTVYYKASDTVITDAATVIDEADGSQEISEASGEISLPGLKAGTEYTYYFVAKHGDTVSEVVSLTFSTEKVAFVKPVEIVNIYTSHVNLWTYTNAKGSTVYYVASQEEITDWSGVVNASGVRTRSTDYADHDISIRYLSPATEYTYYFVAEKDGCYSDVIKCSFRMNPMAVFIKAGETEEIPYGSLADAVAAAKANPGSTIKLMDNFGSSVQEQSGITVEAGEDFIIDLNGKQLLSYKTDSFININGGKLSIINSGGTAVLSTQGRNLYMPYFSNAIFMVTGGELTVSGNINISSASFNYARVNGADAVVSFSGVNFITSGRAINIEAAKSVAFSDVTFNNGTLRINNAASATISGGSFKDVLLDCGILSGGSFTSLKLGTFTIDNDKTLTSEDRTEGADAGSLLQAGYTYQNSDGTTATGEGSYALTDIKVVAMTELSGTFNITGGTGVSGVPVVDDTLTAEFTLESGSTAGFTYTWYRVKNGAKTMIANGTTYVVTGEDIGAELCCIVINSAKTGQKEAVTAAVVKKSVNAALVTLENTSYIYDGTEKKPLVTSVVVGTATLVEGRDYTVAYSDNIKAGTDTAKAVITGIGDYEGSITEKFSIGQREVTVAGITAVSRPYDGTTTASFTYDSVIIDGKLADDELTVTAEGSFADKNAGEGKQVNITGITLTGADAANYKLAELGQQITAAADINALLVTVAEAPVLSGTYGDTVEDMGVSGGKVVDRSTGTTVITGTWTVSDTRKTDIPKVGAVTEYELTFTPTGDFAGGYQGVTHSVAPAVSKKTVSININNDTRKFGEQNPAFTYDIPEGQLVAGDTESAIRVELRTEAVKDSVVGPYPITGTAQSDNYDVNFNDGTLTVTKADSPVIQGENQEYSYIDGSGSDAVTVNVAGKLPADRGTTTYAVNCSDGEAVLDSGLTSVNTDGVLSYKVKGSLDMAKVGAAATVSVSIEMQNYEDATYVLTIKIIDKTAVEVKSGSEVAITGSNALTYGQKLSELILNATGSNKAVFVEAGTSKTVEGTLAWKNPDEIPAAGTTTATWVFTPTDNTYATVENTVAITVSKAKPVVSEAPEVAGRIYNPNVKLTDGDLTGGIVKHTVGGTETEVAGTWSWQTADIVPTAGNAGYTAVFEPDDTANYETVTRTVAVTVEKAVPYISTAPAASAITYGAALGTSVLSDGVVWYSSSDSTVIEGHFAWKNDSDKPVVADSGTKTYTVVFTPYDTINYNTAEAEITLTVNKAANPPKMPGDTMSVQHGKETVGAVALPKGWEWQESDRTVVLEPGVPVSATAVYIGADKGNYENETVTVVLTRSTCNHNNTVVRNESVATCWYTGYTGDVYCADCGELVAKGTQTAQTDYHGRTETRGYVAAGCTVGGYTGDSYCTICGAKVTDGTVTAALGHNYSVTVTKEATASEAGVRSYTCTRCGDSYTEEIPRLEHQHSYISRITKAATAKEEGVMTYTCGICGDTYTRPIAKLQETVTDMPYIKGDADKNGWEAIKKQLASARDKAAVTVAMNGTTAVPGDVFDTIRGRDVNIVLDMGNGITWSINGLNITADKVKDIDFGIKTGAEANNTIPAAILNKVTGEKYYVNLSLSYTGEFGFKAVLSMNVKAKNAGLFANLYYYNEQTGALEFICADKIATDGIVKLTFTHASEYTVVIDEKAATEPTTEEPTTEPSTEAPTSGEEPTTGGNPSDKPTSGEEPTTGENPTQDVSADVTGSKSISPLWFIVIGILVVATGVCVFLIVKLGKRED